MSVLLLSFPEVSEESVFPELSEEVSEESVLFIDESSADDPDVASGSDVPFPDVIVPVSFTSFFRRIFI